MSLDTLKVCCNGEVRRLRDVPTEFEELRKLLQDRFALPSNYSIVYKDEDGDLITITTSDELLEAIRVCEENGMKSLRVEVLTPAAKPEEPAEAKPAAEAAAAAAAAPSLAEVPTAIAEIIAMAATTAMQAVQQNAMAGAQVAGEHAIRAAEQAAAAAEQAAATLTRQQAAAPPAEAKAAEEGGDAAMEEAAAAEDLAVVHPHVTCDACGRNPIVGVRYKCAVRDDFDLCAPCEAKDADCKYPYLKIRRPSQAPAALITVLKSEEDEAMADDDAQAEAARLLEERLASGQATWGDLRHGGRRWLRDRRCGGGRRQGGGCGGNWRQGGWRARQAEKARVAAEQQAQAHAQAQAAAEACLAAAAAVAGVPVAAPAAAAEPVAAVPAAAPVAEPQSGKPEEDLSASEVAHQEEIAQAIKASLAEGESAGAIAQAVRRSLAEAEGGAAAPPQPPGYQEATQNLPPRRQPAAAAAPGKKDKPMARFVADVTIPDGTEVAPGASFTKTWKMRNDGAVAFPAGARLVNVGGDLMEGAPRPVGAHGPGEEFALGLELQAPLRPGRYIGYWRLQAPEGHHFGHRLWVDVRVAEGASAAAAAAAAAGEGASSPAAAEGQWDWSLVSASESMMGEGQPQTPDTVSEASGPTAAPAAPAPAPAPAPAAEAPAEAAEEAPSGPAAAAPAPAEKWAVPLQQLAEMGFYDEAVLLPLLEKHAGGDAAAGGTGSANNPFDTSALQRVLAELLG
mmetsp:Transcript_52367/g.90098  ORF Transcript_52367/g.90098 Transcript_52367/m.90098 type:complete len:737 (+) Transcript_52367:175-2385(+)